MVPNCWLQVLQFGHYIIKNGVDPHFPLASPLDDEIFFYSKNLIFVKIGITTYFYLLKGKPNKK